MLVHNYIPKMKAPKPGLSKTQEFEPEPLRKQSLASHCTLFPHSRFYHFSPRHAEPCCASFLRCSRPRVRRLPCNRFRPKLKATPAPQAAAYPNYRSRDPGRFLLQFKFFSCWSTEFCQLTYNFSMRIFSVGFQKNSTLIISEKYLK